MRAGPPEITMQVTIHLSGPPEDVAMATAMLSSMRQVLQRHAAFNLCLETGYSS